MEIKNIEKYIGELSPEMQEKARECKDMAELNALLAENDVELSEEALQAVAGGCSAFEKVFTPKKSYCKKCSTELQYNCLREPYSAWYCPKCEKYIT